MIVELEPKEFKKCRQILNPFGQLEAIAVVEGVNPGRIFVDDQLNPTTGIVWLGNNDGFLFIGNEKNDKFNKELNNFTDSIIVPAAKKVKLEWFEAIGNHDKWNQTIERVFENRGLGSWNQKVFTLNSGDYKRKDEPVLEDEYRIVKMSNNLLENKSNINCGFLRSKICEFWSSPEKFFNEGTGYCIVRNNEIVSLCFSSFVVSNIHCINIETSSEHRGRKLAQIAAHNFINECLINNFIPYWDCMELNLPSVSVAKNLGFKETFTYTGYEFSLKKKLAIINGDS